MYNTASLALSGSTTSGGHSVFSNALEAGMIWANSENVHHLPTPFGGVKASGIGREHGPEALDYYLEPKSVVFGGLD